MPFFKRKGTAERRATARAIGQTASEMPSHDARRNYVPKALKASKDIDRRFVAAGSKSVGKRTLRKLDRAEDKSVAHAEAAVLRGQGSARDRKAAHDMRKVSKTRSLKKARGK